MLGRKCPLYSGALVPKRQKNRNEQVDQKQLTDSSASFAAQGLANETETAGTNMHEFLTPHPKHDGGDHHEQARKPKCIVWSKSRIIEQDRADPDGDERANINRKIEPGKYPREQVFISLAELIPYIRGHTGLNAAGAHGN